MCQFMNLKLGNEKCEFGVGNSLHAQIGHKCQSLGHLITIKHSSYMCSCAHELVSVRSGRQMS